ncbi:hypothetical protein ATCCBAA256_19720 [Mycobacterium montefiorense]|nr:hypothetical protein ATCCBAA256_19720 [Mycobacterium montefiorense]
MSDALYAVGLSGLSGRASSSSRARRKSEAQAPDDADAPAPVAAASAKQRLKARRRRGATVKDKAYRYEYMDLEDAAPGPDDEPITTVADSGEAAGPIGFAGAAAKSGVDNAAGLTTLTGSRLSDGPAAPMLPSSWEHDS